MLKSILTYILCLFALFCSAQELPPLLKFTSEDYVGDNQNWMISQSSNGYIYAANNKGLLEFNGAEWVSYPSPNNTIIRAVNVIGDKIYTGCYAELGFWQKNQFGVLEYTSLTSKVNYVALKDEQIWNIIEYKEWAVFQSSSAIFFYNTKTDSFKIITATNIIYKIFNVNQQIYYHVANEGLYSIEDGKPKLLLTSNALQSERIISLFEHEGGLRILTRNAGFYDFKTQNLTHWDVPSDDYLKDVTVFSAIKLKDGDYVLGTISDGVLHLKNNGDFNYQITQKKGLNNNTVLSLFEDRDHNVWTGLDNGINCINVTSTIRTFFDYDGVLGTVYVTKVFKEYLYLGTNQGLFYKKLDAKNDSFKYVEGTAGQVWSLFSTGDFLFCGHHHGTFLINGEHITKISNELGAWDFKPIPHQKNMLLQGNYSGLFILQQENNIWRVKNKIAGFDNSSRYFEISNNNEVWVNHEFKGVYKLQLNDSLTRVTKQEMEPNLPLGKNSSIIKFKGAILYASKEGIFTYNTKLKEFVRDSVLSNTITGAKYISGKLVNDENNRLWTFAKENISYVANDNITNKPVINTIAIPAKLRKGIFGFENISYTSNNRYVLGTANGYITLDLSKLHEPRTATPVVQINAVTLQHLNDKSSNCSLNETDRFAYKDGILNLKYAVPNYEKYKSIQYQYQLVGHSDKWSKWTEIAHASFENLTFGDYTFKVKAKVGNQIIKNMALYHFTVLRPWYFSNMALIAYLVALCIIILITHRAYKHHYVKKFNREKLQNEQAVILIKNEKLNQDIENKNRELAISTMSIIKKNRVLNKIKKELKNSNTDNSKALQLINNNLNDTKDWSFFEQAFNNADKGFLDNIKKKHPDLTPNDLRFCAYLRLNLSSKEMAPLLNISTKSVETKRYRLRKKLGLEHDNGLVNYILTF